MDRRFCFCFGLLVVAVIVAVIVVVSVMVVVIVVVVVVCSGGLWAVQQVPTLLRLCAVDALMDSCEQVRPCYARSFTNTALPYGFGELHSSCLCHRVLGSVGRSVVGRSCGRAGWLAGWLMMCVCVCVCAEKNVVWWVVCCD